MASGGFRIFLEVGLVFAAISLLSSTACFSSLLLPFRVLNFVCYSQESKLYGAHFKEITADAPKSTKITFADSDDE